jgi:hypothetical protein
MNEGYFLLYLWGFLMACSIMFPAIIGWAIVSAAFSSNTNGVYIKRFAKSFMRATVFFVVCYVGFITLHVYGVFGASF